MVLLSTHNICFGLEIRIIMFWYTLLTKALIGAQNIGQLTNNKKLFFFRIVVQNERYEEWMKTLKQLRKLFNEYQERVLNYHNKLGFRVPKARNSTVAQGNFLETLNMSLNCK